MAQRTEVIDGWRGWAQEVDPEVIDGWKGWQSCRIVPPKSQSLECLQLEATRPAKISDKSSNVEVDDDVVLIGEVSAANNDMALATWSDEMAVKDDNIHSNKQISRGRVYNERSTINARCSLSSKLTPRKTITFPDNSEALRSKNVFNQDKFDALMSIDSTPDYIKWKRYLMISRASVIPSDLTLPISGPITLVPSPASLAGRSTVGTSDGYTGSPFAQSEPTDRKRPSDSVLTGEPPGKVPLRRSARVPKVRLGGCCELGASQSCKSGVNKVKMFTDESLGPDLLPVLELTDIKIIMGNKSVHRVRKSSYNY